MAAGCAACTWHLHRSFPAKNLDYRQKSWKAYKLFEKRDDCSIRRTQQITFHAVGWTWKLENAGITSIDLMYAESSRLDRMFAAICGRTQDCLAEFSAEIG
jgi:hypothetical protein